MMHEGDLTITEETTHDYCDVVYITGNLCISGDAILGNLAAVGGYVFINEGASLDSPLLIHIGGQLLISKDTKLIAPLLTRVKGDLTILQATDLVSLDIVGGDLFIAADAKLGALEFVHGTLQVYAHVDLDSLVCVEGDLFTDKHMKPSTPSLATVDGSVFVRSDLSEAVAKPKGEKK